MKITLDIEIGDIESLIKLLNRVSVKHTRDFTSIEPNWDGAPEWAQCWAVDEDGTANWLSDCNVDVKDDCWVFTKAAVNDDFTKDRNVDTSKIDWKNSLRKKP